MDNDIAWNFFAASLFVLVFVGLIAVWYFVGRAGYRRGITHGMQPDSIAGMIVAFVFVTGLAAVYWIARAVGSKHYRGADGGLPPAPPGPYPGP